MVNPEFAVRTNGEGVKLTVLGVAGQERKAVVDRGVVTTLCRAVPGRTVGPTDWQLRVGKTCAVWVAA